MFRILAAFVAAFFMLTALSGTAHATTGHDKQAVCHPVEGKGETGNGWNIISPDKASSHIDEATGAGKHTRKDGRTDVYAVNGTCPGEPVENEAVTPTVTKVDLCGTENDSVVGTPNEGYTSVTERETSTKWVTTFTAKSGFVLDGESSVVTLLTNSVCPSETTDTPTPTDKPSPTDKPTVKTPESTPEIGTATHDSRPQAHKRSVAPATAPATSPVRPTGALPNTGLGDYAPWILVGLLLVAVGTIVVYHFRKPAEVDSTHEDVLE